jgi:carbon monoxide dehydrogenase subunit G
MIDETDRTGPPLIFNHEIRVGGQPETVWSFLWDVDRVGACIPGCRDVEVVEPRAKYRAVLEQRVGPFKATFDLHLDIVEVKEPAHILVSVKGKDAKGGSAMNCVFSLDLKREDERGSVIDLAADVSLFGRMATLGQSVIQRRSEEVIAEFASNLGAALGIPAEPSRRDTESSGEL